MSSAFGKTGMSRFSQPSHGGMARRIAGDTLGGMGRHKTVSDDDVIQIAREVFRAHGHTATTRQIADAIGISEAILYQRFGSKDELFFKAMHAAGPDIERLLGPNEPPGDAQTYIRSVTSALAKHFLEVIPLGLRVMTHPSFDPKVIARFQPAGPASLQQGLADRLKSLSKRGLIEVRSELTTARLLASLAHDWALRTVFAHGTGSHRHHDLDEMVDVLWEGLKPDKDRK
jgi:AcrR family transcriptional regulator